MSFTAPLARFRCSSTVIHPKSLSSSHIFCPIPLSPCSPPLCEITSFPLLDGDGLAAAAEIISCFFPPDRLGILLPFPRPLSNLFRPMLLLRARGRLGGGPRTRRGRCSGNCAISSACVSNLDCLAATRSLPYAIRRRGRETPHSSSALCPTSSIDALHFPSAKVNIFWRNRVFIHQSMIN